MFVGLSVCFHFGEMVLGAFWGSQHHLNGFFTEVLTLYPHAIVISEYVLANEHRESQVCSHKRKSTICNKMQCMGHIRVVCTMPRALCNVFYRATFQTKCYKLSQCVTLIFFYLDWCCWCCCFSSPALFTFVALILWLSSWMVEHSFDLFSHFLATSFELKHE